MVPGILVLLLTMTRGFITALNIVKEKEIGTTQQINVTPIQKWQFIVGKLIPFWMIGMIVFTTGLCRHSITGHVHLIFLYNDFYAYERLLYQLR